MMPLSAPVLTRQNAFSEDDFTEELEEIDLSTLREWDVNLPLCAATSNIGSPQDVHSLKHEIECATPPPSPKKRKRETEEDKAEKKAKKSSKRLFSRDEMETLVERKETPQKGEPLFSYRVGEKDLKSSPKSLRKFIRSARHLYPEFLIDGSIPISTAENDTHMLHLNGRHASRCEGAALYRGIMCLNAFKACGIDDRYITIALLKDCGFGAISAKYILKRFYK